MQQPPEVSPRGCGEWTVETQGTGARLGGGEEARGWRVKGGLGLAPQAPSSSGDLCSQAKVYLGLFQLQFLNTQETQKAFF